MDMRGLNSFITDIRKASGDKLKMDKRVEKELAKIRKKFAKASKLKGYDRKKYVCKLLYIYMMGYEIAFGHIEAVNLLSSEKYSEKHIGYLACTLLLNESHELVTMITQCLKRDLMSKIPNYQCLALTAIANIGGREQAEALSGDVQKLLVAGETKSLVRKKAAFTLLKLYRRYPEMLPAEDWAPRLSNLLQGSDLGVIGGVTSLLMSVCQDDPEAYSVAVPRVIRLLTKLVVQKEFSKIYHYYQIPSPWVQVKFFRFLQYFPPPTESSDLQSVEEAIRRVLKRVQRLKIIDRKPVSRMNALHAVLFEALNLAISYDSNADLLIEGANVMGKYLDDRDTNLRYLSLDTLSRFAFSQYDSVLDVIRKKQTTILLALKDPDISIRRRALDLLYSMCNSENAGQIVGELLDYLSLADYAIREELVLKIAILAEKYATDLTWYVDVMLNLMGQSGDFASQEIWYRIVQIVTNSEDEVLARYAAQTVFEAVSEPSAHERCIEVAAYLLGEFGYLIAKEPKSSFMEQFRILVTKFELVHPPTKSIILTACAKFFNLCTEPEFRRKVTNLFRKLSDNLDSEIQNRANEYLQLCLTAGAKDTIGTCLDQMPTYPHREGHESILIDLIKKQTETSTDRGVRVMKHHETTKNVSIHESSQQERPTIQSKKSTQQEDVLMMSDDMYLDTESQQQDDHQIETFGGSNDILGGSNDTLGGSNDILGGLDDFIGMSSIPTHQPPQQQQSVQMAPDFDSIFGSSQLEVTTPQQEVLTGPIRNEQAHTEAVEHLRNLMLEKNGISIKDDIMQVSIESEYHGHQGKLKLNYGNITNQSIEKVRFEFHKVPGYEITFSQNSPLITQNAQISQYVKVLAQQSVENDVNMSLYFEHQRKSYRFDITLPISIHKFIETTYFQDSSSFFEAWKAIPTGEPTEQRVTFKTSSGSIDHDACQKILQGYNLSVMKHIDRNPQNLVASGDFCSAEGKVSVLVRLECNPQINAYRVTVRSNNPTVSKHVMNGIHDYLK